VINFFAFVNAQQNRILWRYEMESAISGFEVSVGPDGTIYTTDNINLYALNPDGTLKWKRPGLVTALASPTSIDFLPDGTILTGTDYSVVALNNDGSTKWTYAWNPSGTHSHIEVGPSVGPDGNIYAVTGVGEFANGIGVFSLTQEGSLRWSDQGNPPLAPINSSTGGQVFFTQERLIFPFRTVTNGANQVYGYNFNGQQKLYVDFTCTGIPRTDPLNRLLITSACGIEAMEQDGNVIYWNVNLGSNELAPAIGADAIAYAAVYFGNVTAINPDGTIKWTSTTATDAIRLIAVRQDVARLVYSGATNFGVPDFVSGVETETGALLWTINLTTINGHNELVWTAIAPTSADGSVVYFNTRFTSNGAPGALYAVGIRDVTPVELISFTANGTNSQVLLNWTTATESNNIGFEIERSKGEEFYRIGFVEGNGTTTEIKEYSFVDNNVVSGEYKYRLKQIDYNGSFEYSYIIDVNVKAPSSYILEQNYPNPFNPSTKIKYSISHSSSVELKIYDIVGREVESIVNEEKSAGIYEVEFDATGLPSGTYFYQMKAGSFIETKKMVLMK